MITIKGKFIKGPNIVMNGLVLYLDAANTKSYPGSGTVWMDLSRGGNSGTLTNGPTFNSSNGGNIVFDGLNDYFINSISTGFTSAMTVMTIAKSTNSTWNNFAGLGSARYNNGYIIHNNYNSTTVNTYIIDSAGSYTQVGTLSPSNIQNYNFYVLTTNGSNSHKSYLNGTLVSNSTTALTRTNTGSSQSNYLGLDSTISDRFTALSIASHLIYNRELSGTEVLQNFNALRSRFGV